MSRSARKMLIISPVFPPARGGIETLTEGIVRRLDGEWQIKVVTLAEVDSTPWDATSGLDIRRAKNEPRGGRRSVARMNALAMSTAVTFRPTTVLSMHVRCSPGAHAAQFAGARWVQYFHAKEIAQFPAAARRATRHADVAVAVSRYTAGLATAAGLPADRLSIIPPAVDLATAAARQPSEAPTILTMSRMADPYKGHDVILDALPHVLAHVPNARWVIIGDGPERAKLIAEVARRGLSEHVLMLGTVSDEARDSWLASAHVFALPSRVPVDSPGGEGFGIVFLEAAAAGIPVVAGNAGGAVDAVDDGRTGLLVAPESAAAVGEAITRLLTNPGLRTEMGRNGQAWAATFTWSRLMGSLDPLLLPHH